MELMVSPNPLPDLLFIDCEASSLDRPSFPVEVGWAKCDGSFKSFLVLPPEAWDSYRWDPDSQGVHMIARSDLFRHGIDPAEVVAALGEAASGKTVVSDAPEFDAYWLQELHLAAVVPMPFVLVDFKAVLDGLAGTADIGALEAEVSESFPKTHRAADDALHLAVLAREAVSRHRKTRGLP